MISSLLHLVGLRPRVYYTLTNFRGGGGQGPPLNTPMTKKSQNKRLPNTDHNRDKREQAHSNTKLNTGIADAADLDHKRETTQWRTDRDTMTMKTQEIKRDTTGEKDGHKQLMRDRGITTTVVK